ncbi:MAG: hypothetical protein ACK5TJ_01365 [Brevundimonas sp.]|jgi:hypothetical protein|nr:hypothetical protein [Brevundimonas sp.]MCA3718019.1 hypothetical protein [Brevundimonas sp.]
MMIKNKAMAFSAAVLLLTGCNNAPEANAPEDEVDYDGVETQAVMMGGDATLDACGGLARVRDGATLAVRAVPVDTGAEAATLPAGAQFWMCDDQQTGWIGIVYGEGGSEPDCPAVASPSASRVSVPAECPSGWVKDGDAFEVVAG